MLKLGTQFVLIAATSQLLLSPLALAQYSVGKSAVSSGARGAIGGAALGAVFGGSKGAARGAAIGGALGTLRGGIAAHSANQAIARANAGRASAARYASGGSGGSSSYASDDDDSGSTQPAPLYVSTQYFEKQMGKIPDPFKLDGSYFEFVTRDQDGGLTIDDNGSGTIARTADVAKIVGCATQALSEVKKVTSPQIKVVMLEIENRMHEPKEADTYIVPEVTLVAGSVCRKRDPANLNKFISCDAGDIKPGSWYDRNLDYGVTRFYPDSISSIPKQFGDGTWHTAESTSIVVSRVTFDPEQQGYLFTHNSKPAIGVEPPMIEVGRMASHTPYADSRELQPLLNHEHDIVLRTYGKLPGTFSEVGENNTITISKTMSSVEKKIVPELDLVIGLTSSGKCMMPDLNKIAKSAGTDWQKMFPNMSVKPTPVAPKLASEQSK